MRIIYKLETIREKLRPIFESYPINRAVLFGSYARGEATPDSDLDIAVNCEDELRGLRFFGVWVDLEDTLGKEVDLVDETSVKIGSPIYENMRQEGVVIYEKTG